MKMRAATASTLCFFFQAEDGIRDRNVTGVQTCALPIYFVHFGRSRLFASLTQVNGIGRSAWSFSAMPMPTGVGMVRCRAEHARRESRAQIGRASCRERAEMSGGAGPWNGESEAAR